MGGLLLPRLTCKPQLESLREFRDGHREWRPSIGGNQSVVVSAETWQLIEEYDVPDVLERSFGVHIRVSESSSKQVQLTLHGRIVVKVARMLADPPRKLELNERVGFWLISEGANGLRVKDIRMRSGALVKPSRDYKSVLLVGSAKATLAAKSIIDKCDCIEEFDTDDFVGFYLVNNDAFHLKRLGVETDALISPVPKDGATTKWKAEVVGPTESVKRLRSILAELHVKSRQIPQAVVGWLTHPRKGSRRSRAMDFERKFDTCINMGPLDDDDDPIRMVDLVVVGEVEENVDAVLAIIAMGPPDDDSDPASMADFAVVGECEDNVDRVFAAIENIVVEKVNITKLQEEFWMGHEDEDTRNRPLHKLEDATDTYSETDFGAGCMHVAGRPEDVKHAVERISKSISMNSRSYDGSRTAIFKSILGTKACARVHVNYAAYTESIEKETMV
ncbi:hypothetical protein AAVH_13171 [Aphelenchoides avenae]|nr:hypothetical protein AAVH_13171 [Aphelenchus avenae]